MGLDQGTLCAFTQGIGAHGYQRGFHCLSGSPQLHKLAAQSLKRMQQPLTDTLPLGQCPVVVPSGQQIECVHTPGHDPQVIDGSRPPNEAASPGTDDVHVDENVITDGDAVLVSR